MTSLALRGEEPEWADTLQDLAALQEVEVEQNGHRYRLRFPLEGFLARCSGLLGSQSPRLSGRCDVVPRTLHVHANARYTGIARNQLWKMSLAIADKHFRTTEALTRHLTSLGVDLEEAG